MNRNFLRTIPTARNLPNAIRFSSSNNMFSKIETGLQTSTSESSKAPALKLPLHFHSSDLGISSYFKGFTAENREKREQVNQVLFLNSRKNNTHICISLNGRVVAKSSVGLTGLKKGARSSPDGAFAMVMSLFSKLGSKLNPAPIHLVLKGFGRGREQAVRAIKESNLTISQISDVTPIRFGGCRPKKPRRL